MEQQAFIQLLDDLVNCKQQEIRQEKEQLYYALRAKDPSDDYINLMVNAIQNENQTISYLASKLFIKDITNQDDKCALKRSSTPEITKQLISHFLQLSATNPQERYADVLIAVINIYSHQENDFTEIQAFCAQAIQQSQEHLTFMLYFYKQLCNYNLSTKFPECLQFMLTQLQDKLNRLSVCTPEKSGSPEFSVIFKQIEYAAYGLTNLISHEVNTEQSIQNLEIQTRKYVEVLSLVVTALNALTTFGKDKQANDLAKLLIDLYDLMPNFGKAHFDAFKDLAIRQNISDDLRCSFVKIVGTIFIENAELKNKQEAQMLQYFESNFLPWLVQDQIQKAQNSETQTSIRQENVEGETLEDNVYDLFDVVSRSIGVNKSSKQIIAYMKHENEYTQIVGFQLLEFFIKYHGSSLNHEKLKTLYKEYKNKMLQVFSENYASSVNLEQAYYRRMLLSSIEYAAEYMTDFIHKDQETFMMILLRVYLTEQHYLLKQEAIYQIGDIIQFFSNETYIKYKNNILQIFREQLETSIMQTQTEVITLFNMCMEVCSKFEQTSLVQEFTPKILSKFKEIIDSLIQQPNYVFTHDAIEYVESILESIEVAMRKVPKQFEQMNQEICQAFLLVLKQSCNNNQPKIIEKTIDCLTGIIVQHQEMLPFIGEMYIILKEIISQNLVQLESSPLEESQMEINNDLIDTQVQALYSLSSMLMKVPEQFTADAENLIQLLEKYSFLTEKQMISVYWCKSALAMVFVNDQQRYRQYIANIQQESEKQMTHIDEYDLTELMQYAENVNFLVTSYCKYFCMFNDINIQQTFGKHLLETLNTLIIKMKNLYIETSNLIMNDSEMNEGDQQERLDEVLEEFQDGLESIYAAFSEFIEQMGDKIDDVTLESIFGSIQELLKAGIESLGAIEMTTVGVDLLDDIAQYSPPAVINKVFSAEMISGLKALFCQQKNNIEEQLEVIFSACQCLTSYIKKTRNFEVASDTEMLKQSVLILKECKDMDSQADSVMEQVCCYLAISGEICNQQDNYWQNVAGYAMTMNTSAELIEEVLVVFMNLLQNGKIQGKIYYDLIVTLFFGEHYESFYQQTAFKEICKFIVSIQSKCEETINKLASTPGIHSYNIELFKMHLQELNQQ